MPSGASVETLVWKRSHSAVAAAAVGHPADRATVVGPVISAAHRDRVEACVELGRRRAREWSRVAPGPPTWTGVSTGPHPPQRLHPGMRVVREEIFGPVVVVVPFDDEEEGVALANDSDYGLIDYVWSGDVARALRVARRLRAGPASTRSGGTWRPRSAGSRRAGWGGTWARTPCTPTARHRRSSGPDEPVAEQRGKILNPPKTDRATVTVRRHARLSGMHCKVSRECDLALMKCFGGVGCGIQG